VSSWSSRPVLLLNAQRQFLTPCSLFSYQQGQYAGGNAWYRVLAGRSSGKEKEALFFFFFSGGFHRVPCLLSCSRLTPPIIWTHCTTYIHPWSLQDYIKHVDKIKTEFATVIASFKSPSSTSLSAPGTTSPPAPKTGGFLFGGAVKSVEKTADKPAAATTTTTTTTTTAAGAATSNPFNFGTGSTGAPTFGGGGAAGAKPFAFGNAASKPFSFGGSSVAAASGGGGGLSFAPAPATGEDEGGGEEEPAENGGKSHVHMDREPEDTNNTLIWSKMCIYYMNKGEDGWDNIGKGFISVKKPTSGANPKPFLVFRKQDGGRILLTSPIPKGMKFTPGASGKPNQAMGTVFPVRKDEKGQEVVDKNGKTILLKLKDQATVTSFIDAINAAAAAAA